MFFIRISSLVVGLSIILQWLFFLVTGNVPEFETTPISIIFHISIEFITASMLILTAAVLKKPNQWKIILSGYAQGMLGYTVVNSAGYFAQSGDWLFVIMFAFLACISMLNCSLLLITRY